MTNFARGIDFTYLATTALCCAAFVAAAFGLCISVYRHGGKGADLTAATQARVSRLVEIVWTVIPVALLLAVFFASAQLVVAKKPDDNAVAQEPDLSH